MSLIVVEATIVLTDPARRDEAVAASVQWQQATRSDEPGCLAYCFAADPVLPDTIQVYELWEDEASLAAHFTHPNYLAMRDLLIGRKPTGSWNRMYRTDRDEPVYGPNGEVRSKFFID